MKTKLKPYYFSLLILTLAFTVSCTNDSTNSPVTNSETTVMNFSFEVPKDTAVVTMTQENEILWNGVKIDSIILSDSLEQFIDRSIKSGKRIKEYDNIGKQNRANYVVSLSCYPQTAYGLYTYFMDELATVIDKLRNEYSEKIYQKSFEELVDEETIIMRSIINYDVLENPHKLND